MKNFEILSKGRGGKILLEVLEGVMSKVADVRKNLNVRPDIQNEVRLGVIQIIQEELVDKLKVVMGELSPQDPNEHL